MCPRSGDVPGQSCRPVSRAGGCGVFSVEYIVGVPPQMRDEECHHTGALHHTLPSYRQALHALNTPIDDAINHAIKLKDKSHTSNPPLTPPPTGP